MDSSSPPEKEACYDSQEQTSKVGLPGYSRKERDEEED